MSSEEAQSMYRLYRETGMSHEQAMEELQRLGEEAAQQNPATLGPNAAGNTRGYGRPGMNRWRNKWRP
jgi:hypothetical protein